MDYASRSRLVHATLSGPDQSLLVMELVLPSVPLVGSIVTIYAEEPQRYRVLEVLQPDGGAGPVHLTLEPA